MTSLTAWVRNLGAAGATTNAAVACERRRSVEEAVDVRLEAFRESEQIRTAAAGRSESRRRTTRAA